MATIVHGFDWPDRFVVGTIGEPGSRAFYLQARTGPRIVSIILEKEQCAVLAEKIDELLDALADDDDTPFSVPTSTAAELVDIDPLDLPVEPEFRAGAIGLGWDPATAQVVIEAFPIVDDEESEEFEPEELFVVRIPVGTARAFAHRTREIVAAGRS